MSFIINKRKSIGPSDLKFMSRINEEEPEQDESESGTEGEDEIVPVRSTRKKKNKANNQNIQWKPGHPGRYQKRIRNSCSYHKAILCITRGKQ